MIGLFVSAATFLVFAVTAGQARDPVARGVLLGFAAANLATFIESLP